MTDWEDCPLFAPAGSEIPNLAPDSSTPALAALSHLIYDEDTPLEASELLRDEGNRQFKRGNKHGCRGAIAKYTDAINAAKDDEEALAPAYLNRAIAHFRLANYRTALEDATTTLKYDPSNIKARFRLVEAASKLAKYQIVIDHCTHAFSVLPDTSPQRKLFQTHQTAALNGMEKDQKRQQDAYRRQLQKRQKQRTQTLLFKSHNLTMGAPLFARQKQVERPYSIQNKLWSWRVLLVYPAELVGGVDQSDTLQSVDESATMVDIISVVFAQGYMQWDVKGIYSVPEILEVRYRRDWTKKLADLDPENEVLGSEIEHDHLGDWVSVDHDVSLGELLQRSDYITPCFPVLYVVPRTAQLA